MPRTINALRSHPKSRLSFQKALVVFESHFCRTEGFRTTSIDIQRMRPISINAPRLSHNRVCLLRYRPAADGKFEPWDLRAVPSSVQPNLACVPGRT